MAKKNKNGKNNSAGNHNNYNINYNNYVDDEPNQSAHLGIRAAYVACSFGLLGMGIDTSNSFFVALEMFAISLIMDYIKFIPKEKWRKFLRKAELLVVGFWAMVGFWGLVGIIVINEVGDSVYIMETSNRFIAFHSIGVNAESVWYWIGTAALLPIIDWIASYTGEKEISEVLNGTNSSIT